MAKEYSEALLAEIDAYAHGRLGAFPFPVREYHLATIIDLITEVRRLRTENEVLRAKAALSARPIAGLLGPGNSQA